MNCLNRLLFLGPDATTPAQIAPCGRAVNNGILEYRQNPLDLQVPVGIRSRRPTPGQRTHLNTTNLRAGRRAQCTPPQKHAALTS